MLPPSQKFAGHSVPVLFEGRSYFRRETLFSVGRTVPGLWYDYHWLVAVLCLECMATLRDTRDFTVDVP